MRTCNNCSWNNGQECRKPGFPAKDYYFEGEDCPSWEVRKWKTLRVEIDRIKEKTKVWLATRAFDGLYNTSRGCACTLEDLMPRDRCRLEGCLPGYIHKTATKQIVLCGLPLEEECPECPLECLGGVGTFPKEETTMRTILRGSESEWSAWRGEKFHAFHLNSSVEPAKATYLTHRNNTLGVNTHTGKTDTYHKAHKVVTGRATIYFNTGECPNKQSKGGSNK
jgi:hypothetical protein